MDPVSVIQVVGSPGPGERLLSFALSVLVGGLALFVSGRFLADVPGYDHAVVTALIGALAWAFLSPIPLLGPVIALVGWIAVLKWRYPVGWIRATGVGVGAWAAAVVVVAALELLGLGGVGAIGIPGV